MKVRIRRLITVSTIGIIALAALIYGFLPKPVLVETAKAVRDPFRVTIEEEGKTRVKDRFVVSAPVAGFMRRVELKAGDAVEKGMPLFTLEPLRSQTLDPRSRAEAKSAVSAARASVKAAEKREESAGIDAEFTADQLNRFQRLLASGAIAQEQFDQAEAAAKSAAAVYMAAQAATNVARSELKRAESILNYSATSQATEQEAIIVRSPKAGRVLRLYQESEGAVNMGQPVLEIGDPRDIEVRVELLSSDAVKISQGTVVSFEHWGGGRILTGQVSRVEPSGFTKISSLGVEEQRVLVIVDMTSAPDVRPQLGDGYRIEADFTVWEGENVLQIPASALFRVGEKWAVFLTKANKARQKIVAVGHRNGLRAEILSGLNEGDTVIAQPDDAITDGGRIKVRKTEE
ncbi:MAG: efflux RND transporter periplasmic adaptor subunit [Deltaproteobacteria bacterium]|nr:efflux RND transporter periplasmic adaptor subunit [Deltaproteobacteria bacterium]